MVVVVVMILMTTIMSFLFRMRWRQRYRRLPRVTCSHGNQWHPLSEFLHIPVSHSSTSHACRVLYLINVEELSADKHDIISSIARLRSHATCFCTAPWSRTKLVDDRLPYCAEDKRLKEVATKAALATSNNNSSVDDSNTDTIVMFLTVDKRGHTLWSWLLCLW